MFGAGAAFEMRQIGFQLPSMRRVPGVRVQVSAASFTHNAEGLASDPSFAAGLQAEGITRLTMLQRFCSSDVRMGPVLKAALTHHRLNVRSSPVSPMQRGNPRVLMHNLDLILTLTGGLVAALVFGYLTQRVGLSPIVGYLLAGLVVGPNTPGFVANKHLADQLAEVGVILLMFGVGLQFHLKELLEVRRIAIPGALGQILVATGLGYVIGTAMNWGWAAGTVFGLAISVASTVVLLRVLADNNDLHTPTGHIAVGWLVVEDLFTVLVLVLLPVVFGSGDVASANVPLALVLAVAKLGVLVVFTLVAGGRLIPWVLGHVARTNSRELFTLTILVLALGIAVMSAKLFGASMAIGAFLAGMVVGRSDFSQRAASEALPMRDAFAVLFFVSVGMLFDPKHLAEAPGLVAATLAVVLVGKPVAALIIVWFLRCPLRTGISRRSSARSDR